MFRPGFHPGSFSPGRNTRLTRTGRKEKGTTNKVHSPHKTLKTNPLSLPTHKPRMNRAILGQAPHLAGRNFQVSPGSTKVFPRCFTHDLLKGFVEGSFRVESGFFGNSSER